MASSRIHDSRDGWYFVTPGMAQKLLDEQPMNRPLREAKAQRFAREMRLDNWNPNGEPVILDEDGKLLDGQGRCRASVISGKPFETYIIHGIPRKYFVTVDTGQVRGGGDTLSFAGSKNSVLSSAICKWGISCDENSPSSFISDSVSNDAIRKFYLKNKDEIDSSIEFCRPHFSKCPIPPSVICFVFFRASKINRGKAEAFALGVLEGVGLTSTSPMLVLRNRMISIKGESHVLTQMEKLALSIKAWNAFIQDRGITLLKWGYSRGGKGKNREAFPWFESENEETA